MEDEITFGDVALATDPLGPLLETCDIFGGPLLPKRVEDWTKDVLGSTQLRTSERHRWERVGRKDEMRHRWVEEMRWRQRTDPSQTWRRTAPGSSSFPTMYKERLDRHGKFQMIILLFCLFF